GVVAVGRSLVAVGSRDVDDVRPRVDFGLGHNVRGREPPGLAHFQQVVVVADQIGDAGQVADERIDHGDAGQRLVARVLDQDRIADHFTGDISRAAWNRRALYDFNRLGVG